MKNRNYHEFFLVLVSIFLMASGVAARSVSNIDSFPYNAEKIAGCNDQWDTTFTSNGANGQVNTTVPDGNGNIYIGGSFSLIQGVNAAGIAKWDGTQWSALGSGINGSVHGIAISGNDIYVAGDFSVAGGVTAINVAKWNGSSWSALGSGLGGGTHYVRSVAVYGTDVYFGGNFAVSDGSPGTGIVKWNGSTYSALPIAAGQIRALAVNNGALYVGGFVAPTATPSVGIVKFDGTNWTALGTLANSSVNAITFSGSDMYVGGQILLTGQPSSHVAKFDGTTWTRLGFFSDGVINAVAVHGGEVYVGGSIPATMFNNLARWTGTGFAAVTSGITGGTNSFETVKTLSSVNGTLYVGGNYTISGGLGALNLSRYSSGTWEPFHGTGLDSPANAIAVSGNDVFVGGTFTTAGTVTANKIAKWNNLTGMWTALGTGTTAENTSINAIAVAGNKIYAGGNFGSIGGVSANAIAVWNGTFWAPLGTGITGSNARVNFIIVRGEDVYVGGDFTSAGGVAANRVAKWDGTSWSGLNSAHLPTAVTGMAFKGDDLYVATGTTTVANPAYFSKFDGTTWTMLGADLGDRGVSSVAVIGDDIYVTGGFTTINGVTVNRIAKYNNGTWTPLGNGLPPINVTSGGGSRLTASGNDLIAVGDFSVASGGPANRIARWNGTTWTGFGTGADAAPNAVFAGNGDVLVGGPFATTGCRASPYFSRWRETVWNGSTNTDWHNAANWGGSTVPPSGAGVNINAGNASITSSDVTLSSLVVASGRTLTVGAGRTLTVNGRFDVANGTINGPGTIVVNGDLTLNGGTIAGAGSLTVNGNLNLVDGTIAGNGPVNLTTCRPTSLSGGSGTSFINSPLTRCVNSTGTYRFPVGSNGFYVPVELSGVVGTGSFTVEPKTGAFSGPATGLPANRLQRWWNTAATGFTQGDLVFNYLDTEVVGIEGRYRAYRINAGTAELVPTSLNRTTNRATVSGATSFAAWTLAEGPATFETLTGRITTPQNRKADRVVVSMTDGLGNVRYALTNPFGFYRFMNVETWKTYTLRLQSKKYTFSSPERTIEFAESNGDVNFVSTDH